MAESANHPGQPTLAAETRALARSRILRAATEVFADRGLDATIDEVAEAASVSRRTVFRHFSSHDELLGAAILEVWRVYEEHLAAIPRPGPDLDSWLIDTAVTLHDLNRRLLGQAFWDIHTRSSAPSAEQRALAEVAKRRPLWAGRLASAAWQAASGKGEPPAWVVDAFRLLISAFASNGLAVDLPRSPDDTGGVSAQILAAVLSSAVNGLAPAGSSSAEVTATP